MNEVWRFSHITTVGCKKSKEIKYYYSSEGRLKKEWYDGKVEYSTPKKTGNNERIYITIAKLFPEICGEWFEGCQVDHINTNRLDNRAENLRCCTPKENMNNPLTKQHCSDAMKKRIEDGVYKEVIYNRIPWNKGKTGYKVKPMSEETKKKIGDANRGKTSFRKGMQLSEETKTKISESHKGRHWYTDELGNRHY